MWVPGGMVLRVQVEAIPIPLEKQVKYTKEENRREKTHSIEN